MAEKKTSPKSVDEYLASVPTKMAPALHALRAAIRAAAPVNWPPFRPDSRHNAGGLRLSSSTGLWLTIIDGSN